MSRTEMPFDHILTTKGFFSSESIGRDFLIFDIGANDGSSIIEYRNAFPDSYIVAFEPCQDAFDLLQKNVESLRNCELIKLALSNKSSREKLFVSSSNCFRDSSFNRINRESKSVTRGLHSKSQFSTTSIKEEEVNTVTLDEFVFTNSKLLSKLKNAESMIKIDVQGSEYQVLLGARRVLETKHVKLIRLELILDDVYDLPYETVPQIFSFLYSMNYRLYEISHLYKDYELGYTAWADLIFVLRS